MDSESSTANGRLQYESSPNRRQELKGQTGWSSVSVRSEAARFAMVGLMLVMAALFSILMPDKFFSYENLRVILGTNSIMAILAVAMLLPLIVGQFDLSGGANLGMSAVLVCALTATYQLGVIEGTILTIGAAAVVGLVNGLLVVRVGINALITTLGTSTVLTGLVLAYTGGRTISQNIPDALRALGRDSVLGMPLPVFYMLFIALMAWYVLEQTPVGRYLYAIGGSKEASRLAGIDTRRLTILTFVASGVLCGIAGVLMAAKLGSGNPAMGPGYMLPAFASAFLGAAAIKPGAFNVLGTVVAIFTVATGVAGLQLMGAAFWVDPVFNGSALIIAVAVTRYLRRQEM